MSKGVPNKVKTHRTKKNGVDKILGWSPLVPFLKNLITNYNE